MQQATATNSVIFSLEGNPGPGGVISTFRIREEGWNFGTAQACFGGGVGLTAEELQQLYEGETSCSGECGVHVCVYGCVVCVHVAE